MTNHTDVPEVSTSGAADGPATPTPTVPVSMFTIGAAGIPLLPPHRMADVAIPSQQAAFEAEAGEFAEAVTTGALLAMARAEIAELRIEMMMIALRDKLGDDAESFAAEYVFPAIEAAENAAEVAA